LEVISIGVVEWFLEAVKKARLFKRNKVSLRHKVKAGLLYMAGLSTRGIAEVVRAVPASREAVRQWAHRFAALPSLTEPKARRCLAVDETKLKLNGKHLFVWAAIDVDSKELVAVNASWQRSSMNAEHILRKALRLCLNKPLILVDKGPWYPEALRSLGLEWRNSTFGPRNPIERWFRTLKQRTWCFCNNLNSRKTGILPMKLFLNLFAYFYNNLRRHQTLGRPPSR